MIEPNLQKIKQEGAELKKEVREKTLGYILTAFGLVAGLAWNEARRCRVSAVTCGDRP